MPLQDDPHASLLQMPEYRELFEIMRSDNPLIALGVTKREVCWTQFQAWLLNPIYHSTTCPIHYANALLNVCPQKLPDAIERGQAEGDPEVDHLRRLLSLKQVQVKEVVSVQAEMTEGESGRSDLVVQCDGGEALLVLLVENKIGTEEHGEQLAAYVAEHLSRFRGGEILLPILLEVGDTPVGSASCPWAVCLDRQDADAWLSNGTEMCVQSGISPPSLAEHYKQVFRSWDLIAMLRTKARSQIEAMKSYDQASPEWDVVGHVLAIPDDHFYREVREDPRLKPVLESLGFKEPETLPVRGYLHVMQFTKPSWTVCRSSSEDAAVNVHFESRNRGTLQIDVEITPYMPSSWKTPERRKTLRPQLEAKSELHRAFRERFQPLSEEDNDLGITLKGLRGPNEPGTCMAVKFDTGLEPDCTPAEQAAFVAIALQACTPIVDSLLEESGFE